VCVTIASPVTALRFSAWHFHRFGDHVILFNFEHRAFVGSEGDIDPKVFVQELKAGVAVPTHLQNCVFQICPKYTYAAKKSTKKALKNAGCADMPKVCCCAS